MAAGDWTAEVGAIHLKSALNFDITATNVIASSEEVVWHDNEMLTGCYYWYHNVMTSIQLDE